MANRDWKIIFISACIITAVGVASSIIVFININKGEDFALGNARSEISSLDISQLHETASYYENKAVEFERIKNIKPSLIDPSI